MPRIAYVNGRFLPADRAAVGIEDRGLQFADSIYEVWRVAGGTLRDCDGHYARLVRSLGELRIAAPMGRAALDRVLHELVRRNRVRDGLVYLQVTRGEAPRDHYFPVAAAPTVIATAKRIDARAIAKKAEQGLAVISLPDIRWGRCDIKTTGLLPNVLAKQAAKEQGAAEAWLVDANGDITEGGSTNAWIVKGGRLITRAHTDNILNGVTRLRVAALAAERQIGVDFRPFSVAEAKAADEAFLTSASGMVLPVVAIDGAEIGDGRPGPVTRTLRDAYLMLAD